MKRLLSFPYTFALLNWAAVVALYYFVTNRQDIWVKTDVQQPEMAGLNSLLATKKGD